jgi:hypothetical protein
MSYEKCDICKHQRITEIDGEPNPICLVAPKCNFIEATPEELGMRHDDGSWVLDGEEYESS